MVVRALSLTIGLVCALATAILADLILPAGSNASAALAVLGLVAGMAGFQFGEWMLGLDETARLT